jgi:phosphatidylethanolamine-binding protein (PEBP) family uncharacterized protein
MESLTATTVPKIFEPGKPEHTANIQVVPKEVKSLVLITNDPDAVKPVLKELEYWETWNTLTGKRKTKAGEKLKTITVHRAYFLNRKIEKPYKTLSG